MAEISNNSHLPLPWPELKEQEQLFLQRTHQKIDYTEQLNAGPATGDVKGFALNSAHFKELQLYLLCALEVFPYRVDVFHNGYPLDSFQPWIDSQPDLYNVLATTLPTIFQHCAAYKSKILDPAIDLAHVVVNFGSNATMFLNCLKEQLEIICDGSVPPEQAKDARTRAKAVLAALRDHGQHIHQSIGNMTFTEVANTFSVDIAKDSSALTDLTARLARLPQTTLLDSFLSTLIQKTREDLAATLRDHGEREHKFEHLDLNYQYKKPLIQARVNVHGLLNILGQATARNNGAQKCLQNLKAGLDTMKNAATEMSEKFDSIFGQIKPEARGSAAVIGGRMSKAIADWNTLLQGAGQITNATVLQRAVLREVGWPAMAPEVIAAHYGGADITLLAKVLFERSNSIVVDTTNPLPIPDPWYGVHKAISLVYRFDQSDDNVRVFVGHGDGGLSCTLTAAESTAQLNGIYWTLTAAETTAQLNNAEVSLSPNIPPPAGCPVHIRAVIHGQRHVTDPSVYHKLYAAAENILDIVVSAQLFNRTGANGWPGEPKSAAIVYTVNGVWKSMCGKENEILRWDRSDLS